MIFVSWSLRQKILQWPCFTHFLKTTAPQQVIVSGKLSNIIIFIKLCTSKFNVNLCFLSYKNVHRPSVQLCTSTLSNVIDYSQVCRTDGFSCPPFCLSFSHNISSLQTSRSLCEAIGLYGHKEIENGIDKLWLLLIHKWGKWRMWRSFFSQGPFKRYP